MNISGINSCHRDGEVEYFLGLSTSTNVFACTESCYARVRGVSVYGTITSIFKSSGKFYVELRLLLIPEKRRFKKEFDTPSQPLELLQSDCIEEIAAADIVGKIYIMQPPMYIDSSEEMSSYLKAEFLVQDFEGRGTKVDGGHNGRFLPDGDGQGRFADGHSAKVFGRL